jgi:cytidylate kinase
MSAPFIVIAVDGGAASGKSSTSRAVAANHNLLHVDTGAHYRTVTLALLRAGLTPADAAKVPAVLAGLSAKTFVEGRAARLAVGATLPADAEIRTPEVNAAVSQFAAIPEVRSFLFNYQRDQVREARERGFAGLIMEGRDIGSVILPDADLRFFLEADLDARAARRVAEGGTDSIGDRDKRDATRATAPMVCPAGATRIDNTHLSLEQVVGLIGGVITERK